MTAHGYRAYLNFLRALCPLSDPFFNDEYVVNSRNPPFNSTGMAQSILTSGYITIGYSQPHGEAYLEEAENGRHNGVDFGHGYDSITEVDPDPLPPKLPLELLMTIASFCEQDSLAALTKSNHVLHGICNKALYRHISNSSLKQMVLCLQTLSRHPQLALNVKTYRTSNVEDEQQLLPSFYRLLSSALQQMRNLDDLTLFINGPSGRIFQSCTFKLRRLVTYCDWDEDLTNWLVTQDALLSALFWGQHKYAGQLRETALPNLTKVSGSPLVLAALVPGRSIKDVELCLIHPWFFTEDILTTLSKILSFSAGPLQTLQLVSHFRGDVSENLAALNAIPQSLPDLRAFALHTATGFVCEEMLNGIEAIISQFKSLRTFMFFSRSSLDALHSADLTKSLAVRWRGACQTLECVSFPDSTWLYNKKYGWVTLKDLEVILAEREKALSVKESMMRARQRQLHRRLEA